MMRFRVHCSTAQYLNGAEPGGASGTRLSDRIGEYSTGQDSVLSCPGQYDTGQCPVSCRVQYNTAQYSTVQ